ncbi:hypothetical protein JKP88DRAFT_283603 [Tribonema minus]|uniref:Uncharacterized protein n=1 Tax=Tribonema minus TaxID=303371 RepID=A0A835YRY0_9STRA|nr:hypothetical protein JKP88DRAFT_283603 [Tribonema minus]
MLNVCFMPWWCVVVAALRLVTAPPPDDDLADALASLTLGSGSNASAKAAARATADGGDEVKVSHYLTELEATFAASTTGSSTDQQQVIRLAQAHGTSLERSSKAGNCKTAQCSIAPAHRARALSAMAQLGLPPQPPAAAASTPMLWVLQYQGLAKSVELKCYDTGMALVAQFRAGVSSWVSSRSSRDGSSKDRKVDSAAAHSRGPATAVVARGGEAPRQQLPLLPQI